MTGNVARAAVDGALAGLGEDRALIVLRGPTGAGKTAVLAALAARGAQILDLEALAGHRGSAFGGLGLPAQPSHDEFQRLVAARWRACVAARVVLCEHERHYLGSVGLPDALERRIVAAAWLDVVATDAARVARIVASYAAIPTDELIGALRRLRARLGASAARAVERALRDGRRDDAVRALLPYYDRAYAYQRAQLGPPLATITAPDDDARAAAVVTALAGHGFVV